MLWSYAFLEKEKSMAKIAFCSDLHINREIIRLTECLNFLDYIGKYCKDNDITHLVIGGDLFDTSNSIRNQMFIPFFNKLYDKVKLDNTR